MTEPLVASGEPPDLSEQRRRSHVGLVGRDREIARLSDVVAAARSGAGGAIVVAGEPGIGKTALLDLIAGRCRGDLVLRANGVESEVSLAYGTLLQLLAPLRHRLQEVPPLQRRAIEAAFAWSSAGDDVGSQRFLAGAATLSLLVAAAEQQTVVVIVDDAHWVDHESAAALLFAARRIGHDRVAMLISTRDSDTAGFGALADDIEPLVVGPLAPSDAAELLGTATAPGVAVRLTDATGGNPLALGELAALLSPAQRRGAAPLPRLVTTGGRADGLFARVLSGLDDDERLAALVVAASLDRSSAPIHAVLASRGLHAQRILERLEDRRILVLEPGSIRYRHPLQRTAAWAAATPAERRATHLALADVVPNASSSLWHRTEAAVDVDDGLAGELEQSAVESRDQHGHAAAAQAFERAARLSSGVADRARRLTSAVDEAAAVGDAERVRRLAHELLELTGATPTKGRALAALGEVEVVTGSIPRAARLLERAAAATSGAHRVRVLAELGFAQYRLGDMSGLAATAQEIAAIADPDEPEQRCAREYFAGIVAALEGRTIEAAAAFRAALALIDSDADLDADPRWLARSILTAGWLELDEPLVRWLEARVDGARRRGALAGLVPALSMFSYGRAQLGDHAAAYADAAEAVELAEELGFVADAAPPMEMLAWQYACRGAHDAASAALDRATQLVERAGTTAAAAHLALARAHAALCRDDVAGVISILEPRIVVDSLRGGRGEPMGAAPMLIEALVAGGRLDDARSLMEGMVALPGHDPVTLPLVERCRGLVEADDDSAIAHLRAAVELHERARDVAFELARTELHLGARLRRAGRRGEARDVLRRARERFDAMDHSVWSGRCTAELAATGETRRHDDDHAGDALTAQEARVEQFVVRGLTNAEVAAAMFLSPKTIEHHLSTIYRKRGVRSRTELTNRLLRPVSSGRPTVDRWGG